MDLINLLFLQFELYKTIYTYFRNMKYVFYTPDLHNI
jgi:hypothetical protein